MEQARLIFIAAMSIVVGAADAAGPSDGTVYRSLLDDLTPPSTLMWLAAKHGDWRGCDGDSNRVVDFWTADGSGLYDLRKLEPVEADARTNDRDGCRVNDFWTVDVAELYKPAGIPAVDLEQAIRLIELSIAAAEEDP